MATQTSLGLLGRGWRNVRSAGPRRLAFTGALLIAAVLLARFSWFMPVSGDAERAIYDLRSYLFAPKVAQDDRVLLVVYNDQTLINARKRSPLDRGLLAKALRNLDTMHPKAIGIDILFDQPQDEDDDLIAALRATKTPISLAYAETQTNADDIIYEQQKYLESLLARLRGSLASPASIRLDDSFGATRTWPKPDSGLPPLLGRAMLTAAGQGAEALPGYAGAIRYRRAANDDRPIFTTIPIDQFADPQIAPLMAPAVAGRYVLIGGSLVDVDRVSTSFTSVDGLTRPGIEIHAEMLSQMLDGARLPHPSSGFLWLQVVLVVLAAALTGLIEMRSWKFIPLLALQAVLFVGLPFWLQARGVDTFQFPAVGPVLGWIIAFAAIVAAARATGAVQRRFAHSALGKYLPRGIAQEIIDRPELLSLHGEKKEIFVLFSDLEGFTKLSHALEPEMVATLLNRYLDTLSEIVLEHGGVIDKFVGDAVVAFWGAPIGLPDDGERAALAGYAIWQAGEAFRRSAEDGLPPIGRTRVGLHFGDAVVGNFGGEGRIQYTALGDAMNCAARLESANKALKTTMLVSDEAKRETTLDVFRPMGRIVLSGRATPVEVWEPVPDMDAALRARLNELWRAFDGGDVAALAQLEEIAAAHKEDAALQYFVYRIGEVGPGGHFVLGSK